MGDGEQKDRKALVFLRDGRVRVADAEDVSLLAHAVEIRLRRSDPADRTQTWMSFHGEKWPVCTSGSLR